jgi:hypothetical protein
MARRNLREHRRQRNDWLRSMKILCSTCHFLASFEIWGLGMIGGPISRCGDWGRECQGEVENISVSSLLKILLHLLTNLTNV